MYEREREISMKQIRLELNIKVFTQNILYVELALWALCTIDIKNSARSISRNDDDDDEHIYHKVLVIQAHEHSTFTLHLRTGLE